MKNLTGCNPEQETMKMLAQMFTRKTLALLIPAGIAVAAFITGCGVAPEAAEVEFAQSPATAAPPDTPTPAMPTATATPAAIEPTEEVSDAADAASEAQATATQPAVNTFPAVVSGESLKGLCKYSGARGSHSTIIHTKSYEEVEGRFELVSEGMHVNTIDAKGNVRWVLEEDGVEHDLFFYVDGVSYNRVSEDEWMVEEDPDFWRGLLPDPDDTPGPVGGTGAPGGGAGAGPGEESGDTTGPVGQVSETPEPLGADTICGDAVDTLTDFMDHGIETLNGVEVRHVAATLQLSPSLPYRKTLDLWVDLEGTLVQSRTTTAQDAMGGYPAKRSEATSTFQERDPTILITVPDAVATPVR